MYYKKFHEISIFSTVFHAFVPLASCKDGFSILKVFIYWIRMPEDGTSWFLDYSSENFPLPRTKHQQHRLITVILTELVASQQHSGNRLGHLRHLHFSLYPRYYVHTVQYVNTYTHGNPACLSGLYLHILLIVSLWQHRNSYHSERMTKR
jgi:hypothetical protein